MVAQGLMIAGAAAGQDSGIAGHIDPSDRLIAQGALGAGLGSEARTEKPKIKSGTNTQ